MVYSTSKQAVVSPAIQQANSDYPRVILNMRPLTAANKDRRNNAQIETLLADVRQWSSRREEQNKSKEDYSLDQEEIERQ